MFTGIIEEVGHVVSAQRNAQAMRLTIAGDVIFSDMKSGIPLRLMVFALP